MAGLGFPGPDGGPEPGGLRGSGGAQDERSGVRIPGIRLRSARGAAAADPPELPPPRCLETAGIPARAPSPSPAGATGRSRPAVIRDAPRGPAGVGGGGWREGEKAETRGGWVESGEERVGEVKVEGAKGALGSRAERAKNRRKNRGPEASREEQVRRDR